MPNSLVSWVDRNILSLGREMRLSYLPPLMVYVAYGISGLTGIVGTFFVKDYLGLSAAFLAATDLSGPPLRRGGLDLARGGLWLALRGSSALQPREAGWRAA